MLCCAVVGIMPIFFPQFWPQKKHPKCCSDVGQKFCVLSTSCCSSRKKYNWRTSFIHGNNGKYWVWFFTGTLPEPPLFSLNSRRFSNSNSALVKVRASCKSSLLLCWEYFQSWWLILSHIFLDLSVYAYPSFISHLTLHLETVYKSEYRYDLDLSFAYIYSFYHTPDRIESSLAYLSAGSGIGLQLTISGGGKGMSHMILAIITYLSSLTVRLSSLKL